MFWKSLLALVCLGGPALAQIPGADVNGPFVRVKRNQDGSRTVFDRGSDLRTLTKKTYSSQGNPVLTTIYRLDEDANPLKCEIFDRHGVKLYKTQFGYSKRPGPTFGKLVMELLFDTRNKRIDPKTGQEMPVHKFIYTYNSDGSPNLPIGITVIKGAMAEDVFGDRRVESQALPDLNEFEKVDPANPNARPLGQ